MRLPPPPRTLRGGLPASVQVRRVLTLPHMLVAIVLPFVLLFQVVAVVFSVQYDAEVTGVHVGWEKPGTRMYTLDYVYERDGVPRRGTCRVDEATYATHAHPELGASHGTFPIAHYTLGPYEQTNCETGIRGFVGRVLPIGIFLVIWDAVCAVAVYHLWIVPSIARVLHLRGEPCRGTIVAREWEKRRGVAGRVRFAFRAPDGERIAGVMDVHSGGKLSEAPEGRPVTVLCWPGKPSRCIVYELSDHEIDGVVPEP